MKKEFSHTARQIIADAIEKVGLFGPIIIDEQIAEETTLSVFDLDTIGLADGTTTSLRLANGAAVIRVAAKNGKEFGAARQCLKRALRSALKDTADSGGEADPDFSRVASNIVADAIEQVGEIGPIIIDENLADETTLEILDMTGIGLPDGSMDAVTLANGAAVVRLNAKDQDEFAVRVQCLRTALCAALSHSQHEAVPSLPSTDTEQDANETSMTEKLQSILEAEGLASLLDKFNEQGVTDSILGDLTDSDLKELGVDKLGERKRLLAHFGKSGGGAVAGSVAGESAAEASGGAMSKTAATPAEATKDSRWVNTLGMPFVPIPRFETRFCIWPVRVQDYEAYCMASGAAYPQIGFQQDSDHPIVSVSWDDAIEFCVWLTGKERAEGRIDDKTVYRLPTDLEWSAPVGLLHEPEATPEARSGKAPGYPWGLRWPPPKGAGNYAQSLEVDSFEHTSPVESFSANAFGLHDMGGNVWEWCMDRYNADKTLRVVRGASWFDDTPEILLSSIRISNNPDYRDDINGFRCVLVGESSR